MNLSLHEYASAPIALPAAEVHRRLGAEPLGLVAAATADSLHSCAPAIRSWGLATSALPVVTASRDDGGVGHVRLEWDGDEDLTGWPSLTGWVVVTASGESSSRLTLLSPRSPESELATLRLGALHRRRLVDATTRGFVRALAERLLAPHEAHEAPLRALVGTDSRSTNA